MAETDKIVKGSVAMAALLMIILAEPHRRDASYEWSLVWIA